jgi:hypothetical protein
MIKVMWAEDLPDETQKEFNVFSGLVEVKITKESPLKIEGIKSVKGTFSQGLRDALRTDGFLGKIDLT